jgi:hypothetical protein
MAKVVDNIFLGGLSGSLGNQLTIKTYKDGRTIICKKPTFKSDHVFSQAQLAHQQAFREASAYARSMQGEDIYVTKAKNEARTAYNLALADWFSPPQILEVDLSGWSNGSGGAIRVKAQDDVRVQGVKVSIADENGTLLEAGEAQEVGALWWEYRPSQAAAMNMSVSVSARDLPGHVGERGEIVP